MHGIDLTIFLAARGVRSTAREPLDVPKRDGDAAGDECLRRRAGPRRKWPWTCLRVKRCDKNRCADDKIRTGKYFPLHNLKSTQRYKDRITS